MSQINSNIKERRRYREDEGGRGDVGCCTVRNWGYKWWREGEVVVELKNGN